MATSQQAFTPASHQANLDLDKLILNQQPKGDDIVPLDVVFVGAGPAGLCGAIELARLVKKEQESGGSLGDIEIGVLEKASSLGGHTLSGAVINPIALRELFPGKSDSEFPFRKKVTHEKVYMLTEKGHIPLPTPPTMVNKGNYVASLCEVVRWLGEQAESLGVNIFTSFPVDSLFVQDQKVVGLRTTPAGLNRQGEPSEQYMPPTDISAQVTVLTEGTRGTLSQAYMQWRKITAKAPQIYALGVKEIWKVKKAPQEIIHTLGWPLPKDTFGGSWLYPMADDMVSLGLVAGLDYPNANLDIHKSLQHMKTHPLFANILGGGECLEWGAKTIPEGGFHALPEQMHGDGLLICGDALGLVNVPALKGVHYAMMSGIYAARSVFAALKAKDTSAQQLKSYDEQVRASFIYSDLKKVRNMRQAFKKGFYMGGFQSALMIATGGAFPGDQIHQHEDAWEPKEFAPSSLSEEKVGLSKVDAVYLAKNKTRDDIPQHLTLGKDISPKMADFYSAMCPAGVYERQGDQLIVNAPNCIDCKATDVLGPRWQAREGGSGPDYTLM